MSASITNITVLIIEKNGEVREHLIKSFNETELYKKAGFKTTDGFKSHTEWNIEHLNDQQYNISVYGKTKGRANQENKYEFPPPIDNTLFFGSCLLVNSQNGIPVSLRAAEWETVYDYLYGGFEDIGDDGDEESEETDEDSGIPLSKYGYAKDGFVVDDDDDEEDKYETEEEEENTDEDGEVSRKKSKPIRKLSAAKKNAVPFTTTPIIPSKKMVSKKTVVIEPIVTDVPETLFECTSELSEEAYLE
jgi:hypothetical protein